MASGYAEGVNSMRKTLLLVILLLMVIVVGVVPPVGASSVAMSEAGLERVNAKAGDKYIEIRCGKTSLLSKDLSLKKNKTATLTAYNEDTGRKISVKWKSENKKIAKISAGGKVTAVGAGMVRIYASKKGYSTGSALIIVKPGSKDPKLLQPSDANFYYNKQLVKTTQRYKQVAKNLPGAKKFTYENTIDYDNPNSNTSDYHGIYGWGIGLCFGNKNYRKAHTTIIFWGEGSNPSMKHGYVAVAEGKSPVKLRRGIRVGSKLSAVQKQYGIPNSIENGKYQNKKVAYYEYTHILSNGYFLSITFCFDKATNKVISIRQSYYDDRRF